MSRGGSEVRMPRGLVRGQASGGWSEVRCLGELGLRSLFVRPTPDQTCTLLPKRSPTGVQVLGPHVLVET